MLLVFGIWEMAPAPCILQYLALCKWALHFKITSAKPFQASFFDSEASVDGVFCMHRPCWVDHGKFSREFLPRKCNIFQHYCSLFFTDVEYRAECAEIGRHVFNVSDDEGVEVHCASLRFEDVIASKIWSMCRRSERECAFLIWDKFRNVSETFCHAYRTFWRAT